MKEERNIKSKMEMSNRITQTSEEILKNIELGDVDGFRQCLQLFIIQYDLYKDILSGNGLTD